MTLRVRLNPARDYLSTRRLIIEPQRVTRTTLIAEHRQALTVLARMIQERPPLVAFTGAGISTESGIPDYRGPNGLWTTGSAKPVMYDEFMSSEETRRNWWNALPERMAQATVKRPNSGHKALVRLEQAGVLAATITQNIDGLHTEAGASADRIVELHGNTRTIRCTSCRTIYPIAKFRDVAPLTGEPPACEQCGGILKSGTVAFGEPMPEREMRLAMAVAQETGVMLVVGSTLTVYPAARIPEIAKSSGGYLAIINIGETALDDIADLRLEAPAGPALTHLADQLLTEGSSDPV